jgi:hypothetical protein
VPLHPAPAPAGVAAAPARLTYRNGPLLASGQVFTIFWGAAWQKSPQSDLVTRTNQFFDFILSSPLLDQLDEYSVPAFKIGHGSRIGTTTFLKGAPKKSVNDTAIRKMLQAQISAGTFPTTNPNTLYFVFLPPGVQVNLGSSASCKVFCGYHDAINGKIFYAVMPYPGCAGCLGGRAAFDALTSTTSHELCEAITDPIPGQGWYDDANGEIGDICAWKTRILGGFTIQLEWSNRANSCL